MYKSWIILDSNSVSIELSIGPVCVLVADAVIPYEP